MRPDLTKLKYFSDSRITLLPKTDSLIPWLIKRFLRYLTMMIQLQWLYIRKWDEKMVWTDQAKQLIVEWPAGIQTAYLLNTILERYRCISLLGVRSFEIRDKFEQIYPKKCRVADSSVPVLLVVPSVVGWAACVGRMRCIHIFIGKHEGRPLGRPSHRWEDHVKMDLRETA
jgi:hypothetical protein